jgi:hypothetical protein
MTKPPDLHRNLDFTGLRHPSLVQPSAIRDRFFVAPRVSPALSGELGFFVFEASRS